MCVHSAPGNKEIRNLIRQTWAKGGRHSSITVRVFFFIGYSEEAERENNEHHDIILMKGYQDRFETIWMKSLAILTWGADMFAQHSSHEKPVRYLMKADDDTFFNIDAVVEDLFASGSPRRKLKYPDNPETKLVTHESGYYEKSAQYEFC